MDLKKIFLQLDLNESGRSEMHSQRLLHDVLSHNTFKESYTTLREFFPIADTPEGILKLLKCRHLMEDKLDILEDYALKILNLLYSVKEQYGEELFSLVKSKYKVITKITNENMRNLFYKIVSEFGDKSKFL